MTASEQISDGTAGGMFVFLDYLVAKGYAPAASINPLRLASRKVLETVDGEGYGDVSISDPDLNIDEHFDRFEHLRGSEYKRESLAAYRQRFEKTVSMYRAYLREGSAWKPPTFRKGGSRAGKLAMANGAEGTIRSADDRDGSVQVDAPVITSTLLEYPFPLIDGQLAHLRLPRALTARDAARIGAFVATLAVDDNASDAS